MAKAPLTPLEYEKELAKGKAEVKEYNQLMASKRLPEKISKSILKASNYNFKFQKGRAIPRAQPTQQLSAAQNMLREMFRGEPTFGTGQNLPKLNGELRTGRGLINNGDGGDTGRMFGVR